MSRALAGYRARSHGAAFEELITRCILDPLVQRGRIARYDHLQPAMRRVCGTPGHRPLFAPVAESGGDWILLFAGGRYAAAEAKSTEMERFPAAMLPAHQQRHLDTANRAGALAFLLLRFQGCATALCHLIPWASVPWTTARTARSVALADCAPWAVRDWADADRIFSTELCK